MSDENIKEFETRLKGIEKNNRKRGRHKTGSNPKASKRIARRGYDVAPERKSRFGLGGIVKFCAWTFVIFLALRIFASFQLGAETYDAKIENLSQGSGVEVTAAKVLQRGPVMLKIEQIIRGVLTQNTPAPDAAAEAADQGAN